MCERDIKRKFRGLAILDTLSKRKYKNTDVEYNIYEEPCRWLRTLFPETITEKYIKDFILLIYKKPDEELFTMYLDTLTEDEAKECVKEYIKMNQSLKKV